MGCGLALVCAVGCAGAPGPPQRVVEPETPVEETSCREGHGQWVHMPILVGADPSQPMDEANIRVLDEVVASVRARPDIVHLRVEGHGCGGEDPERTLARAEFVRDRLIERGLQASFLSTAGYPPPTRGCVCWCEAFQDTSASPKSISKNCITDLDWCRRNRDEVLRVEFSVVVCRDSEPAADPSAA